MKREGYISWDEYFMGVALLAAMRSKDPSTQVGACIVDEDNRILSTGYNGFPSGCSDDEFPWGREGAYLEVKYPFVVHAELNAILNAQGKNLSGAIIQSGIKEVVYLSDKYATQDSTIASKKMFNAAGIKLRQLKTNFNTLAIDFSKEGV